MEFNNDELSIIAEALVYYGYSVNTENVKSITSIINKIESKKNNDINGRIISVLVDYINSGVNSNE